MTLYGFWRSSATWRVRIALAHKGLRFDYVPVNLGTGEHHRPEFHAKNPMGSVPVLELDVGGRPRRLAESLAILELLEELHPEPPLLPKDSFLRARARQIALVAASGIQPLQNTSVRLYVEQTMHADAAAWIRHWNVRGLDALEKLVGETAGRFAVGDAPSFADACLVPQLYFASQRAGVDLAPYPTLRAIDAACARLPAFAAAHAKNQPDTPADVRSV
ncbi:MAG TPA: maleylacetoacetate isomerase [Myxococcales bacterium]|nr:maleylacetoacetate isomerase [Myxococcales bacterium]